MSMSTSRTLYRLCLGLGFALISNTSVMGRGMSPEGELLPDGSWMIYDEGMPDLAEYGAAIAFDGYTLAIGAPGEESADGVARGSVTLYIQEGDGTWFEEARLEDPLLTNDARFGHAVDLEDLDGDGFADLLIVGAPYDSSTATNAGSIYIYEYGLRGDWPSWHLAMKWTIGNFPLAQFGSGVGVSQGIIVGGMPGLDNALSLDWNTRGGLAEPIRIDPPEILTGAGVINFGETVSFDGDTVLFGAPKSSKAAIGGSVYVYRYNSSGGFFSYEESLYPQSPAEDMEFGGSISISGDWAIVGAMGSPWNSNGEECATIFHRSSQAASGSVWTRINTLTPDDGESGASFSSSVAMGTGIAIVGNARDSGAGIWSGSCVTYLYASTANQWVRDATIRSASLGSLGLLGSSAVIDGGLLVAGAMGGSLPEQGSSGGYGPGVAIAYTRDADGVWQSDTRPTLPVTLPTKTLDIDDDASVITTAIAGDWAMLGSPGAWDADGNPDVGHVDVLRYQNGDWVPTGQQLQPSSLSAESHFGYSISMHDTTAVVGAPNADGDAGRVFIYRLNADTSTWEEWSEFSPPLSTNDMGQSVAIDWPYLAVGIPSMHFEGDPSSDTAPGIVQIYRYHDAPIDAFLLLTTISDPWEGSSGNSGFGSVLDIDRQDGYSGAILVAADPHESNPSATGFGTAYLYQVSTTGAAMFDYIEGVDGDSLGQFGSAVDLDHELLAIMDPSDSTAIGSGAAVSIYRNPSWPFASPLTLEDKVTSPAPSDLDFFGFALAINSDLEVLVAGSPWSDYTAPNGGQAVLYQHQGAGDWNFASLLIDPNLKPSSYMGWDVAMSGSTILCAIPDHSTQGDLGSTLNDTSRAVAFSLSEEESYWTNPDGGSMSDTANWSRPPSSGDTAICSMLLSTEYVIEYVDNLITNLVIGMDKVILLMNGEFGFWLPGTLSIAAPPELRAASLTIDGYLWAEGGVHIGDLDSSGSLHVTHGSQVDTTDFSIDIGSNILLNVGSKIQMPVIWCGDSISLAGTLAVELGDLIPEDMQEGFRYQLLATSWSATPPGDDLFDAVVLPGLTNNLAFQLYAGPPKGRNADRGAWEMAIEVVSITGLLNFNDPDSTVVAGDPTGVEVVDLTGDGAEEICVTLAGSPGSLVIFENDGAGGVSQQIVIPTGDEPVDISSGDFDGDGRNDLAVANNLSQDVTVYYNDDNDLTDGFVEEDLNVDGPPTCLAGIDANFDLYGDLVVGLEDTDSDGSGYYAIYLGVAPLRNLPGGMTGGGGIAPSGTPLGVDPSEDEDQKDFMFSGRKTDGKTSVVKGSGVLNGVALSITEHVTGADPGGLTMGDVNGDGRGDICVTSTTNGSVAILLQDTTSPGDFLSAILMPIGDAPTRITSVDFDNDGNTDLAAIVRELNPISGNIEPVVRVLQGNGNLSFTSLETAWGEDTALVASGDVSGDGANELVTIGGGPSFRGSGGDEPLLTLRETATLTCPGDFDGTGDVGIDDLLILLGEFAECTTGCQSDIDDDGDVDIDDMLALIGAWGPCPR